MKKIIVLLLSTVVLFSQINFNLTFALPTEKNDFLLIPESEEYKRDGVKRVERISNSGGHVWDQYDLEAYDIGGSHEKNADSIGEQMATGILNRNSLVDYLVYVLKILSQIAILIGALMFIRNGYQYLTFSMTGDTPKKEKLYNAIIGILVVIFAYAIMRILLVAFIT